MRADAVFDASAIGARPPRTAIASLRRCAFAAMTGLLVAACAVAPPAPSPRVSGIPPDEPFAIDGRVSARRGSEAVTAHFTWTHASPRDELIVATPLGQAVAELAGDNDARRMEVRMADGRRDEARDWATLTERAVGFPLPLAGLAAWVRGVPHGGAPHWIEADAAGRAAVLRQDGWEIVYAYSDGTSRRPTQLRLSYPDLEVRIVVDRWR